MIETALAYIYSIAPRQRFVGCGAVIEGEWVATCRHVLRMALAEGGEGADPLAVLEIRFPHAKDGESAPIRSRAKLSRDSPAIQRIAVSGGIPVGDGVVDGGLEAVEIDEG